MEMKIRDLKQNFVLNKDSLMSVFKPQGTIYI